MSVFPFFPLQIYHVHSVQYQRTGRSRRGILTDLQNKSGGNIFFMYKLVFMYFLLFFSLSLKTRTSLKRLILSVNLMVENLSRVGILVLHSAHE